MLSTTPTRTGPAQILGALGHLLWTGAIVIGAPVALARFFGWPLPTGIPDWGEVVSTPLQLVDPVVILNLFVCLAWICWAIVISYVFLDVVDAVRGIGQRFHRLGPFSIVAGKLVGSLLLLISLSRPNPSHAAPAPSAAAVQLHQHSISLLPATAAAPSHVALAASALPPVAPTPVPAAPVYVVERGDNLWDIAETHLGSGFRWTEIHDLNRDLVADPGIICIGWELTLPVDANVPTASPPPVVVDQAPAPQVETETSVPPTLPRSPITAPEEVPASQDEVAPPTVTEAPTPDPTPSPSLSPVEVEVDVVAEDSGDEGDLLPSLVSVVPGITGATVLATGLLLLLRRVQRRRAATGERVRRPIPPLERTLIAAADLPLVRWAGQELAMLGEQLAGRHLDADPVAVEFSEDYGLELLWSQPFPNAPAPWEAIPGAWAWRLLYDPDAAIPVAERPALIPGLVTFGHRDGRQLMIDLEALGSLSITGDPIAVENFVRSVAAELGSSEDVADAYIAVTPGLVDPTTVDLLPRVDIVDPAELHERLTTGSTSTDTTLAEVGAQSTFAYRLFATPVLPLDVNVALTASTDGAAVEPLVGAAPPRRGVAALIVGTTHCASAHLEIAAEGTARLEPLGVTFSAAGMPRATEHAVAELFADGPVPATSGAPPEEPELPFTYGPISSLATEAEDLTARPEELVIDLTTAPTTAHAASLATALDDWVLPQPRMLVRVLGVPAIVGGPEMGRQEMIVVALMACLGRPTRQDDIQEAVWGGRPVVPRTVWNIIGRTRKQLGTWDDQPILRNVQRPQNTIELDDGVVPDLFVLRLIHDRAVRVPSSEAMPLLHQALDLVHGPPFDADGYDWARVNQHAHEAERLIEACATKLVELALEAGNLDLARYAVLQGLRGRPGNETLYRARMRIEDAAGNATAVRAAFTELRAYLDDLEASPSPETTSLYGTLAAVPPRR